MDGAAVRQPVGFQRRQRVRGIRAREGTRPPEDLSINLSIQRQLSSSMVLEGSYNGVMGSHLQTGLLAV